MSRTKIRRQAVPLRMSRTLLAFIVVPAALTLSACGSDDDGDDSDADTERSVELTLIDDDVPFPEGPLWIDDTLYYTGYGVDQIRTWDGENVSVLWEAPAGEPFTRCGPTGLVQRDSGSLLLSCFDTNTLVEMTLTGEETARYTEDRNGEGFVAPNDFTKDDTGGIYFTASGIYDPTEAPSGKVYYLTTGNEILDAAEGTIFNLANGLVLSDDGDTLFVAEQFENRIVELSVESPGSLGEPEVFADLADIAPFPGQGDAPTLGPDGIRVGPESGDVYAAHFGAARILRIDRAGQLVDEVTMPFDFAVNLGFEGDDESTMFVALETDAANPDFVYSGRLFRVDIDD